MYKISKIIVLIMLFTVSCQASNNRDSTVVLEIKEGNFFAILDSVVTFEKRCDYYTSDLLFCVMIFSDSIIQIGSMDHIIKGDNIRGCFTYQEHLFIVTGKSLRQSLFTVTDKKSVVEYFKPFQKHDPKSGEVIIDSYEDDRFTVWLYRYIDGKFLFQGRYSQCK